MGMCGEAAYSKCFWANAFLRFLWLHSNEIYMKHTLYIRAIREFQFIFNQSYPFTSIRVYHFAEDSYLMACEEEWRRLAASAAENRLMSPAMPGLSAQQLRSPAAPLGAPLILSPRMSVPTTAASLLSASAPPQMEHPGLIYATPYGDYNYALAAGNPLLTEYADHSGGFYV